MICYGDLGFFYWRKYVSETYEQKAPTSQITVSAYIYNSNWSGITGTKSLLSKTEDGGYSFNNESGEFKFYLKIGSSYKGIGISGSLIANGWNHFVATYNGSSLKLYVNSSLVSSVNATGAISYSYNNSLMIASEAGPDTSRTSMYDFAGGIAQIMIYEKGLAEAEVLQNFHATKDRFGL